jgi:hypothetical protein
MPSSGTVKRPEGEQPDKPQKPRDFSLGCIMPLTLIIVLGAIFGLRAIGQSQSAAEERAREEWQRSITLPTSEPGAAPAATSRTKTPTPEPSYTPETGEETDAEAVLDEIQSQGMPDCGEPLTVAGADDIEPADC